jgi:peptide-methionine (R)-S-oxide reductase
MTMTNTEREWREKLTPEQYAVLREKGTERPFTGEHLHEKRDGMFSCAACGADLFPSTAKFESGTGWPSFTQPADRENVDLPKIVPTG